MFVKKIAEFVHNNSLNWLMEQKTQFQVNLYFKNNVSESVLNFKGDTGCSTKYDSWRIVLNVVFHTLY